MGFWIFLFYHLYFFCVSLLFFLAPQFFLLHIPFSFVFLYSSSFHLFSPFICFLYLSPFICFLYSSSYICFLLYSSLFFLYIRPLFLFVFYVFVPFLFVFYIFVPSSPYDFFYSFVFFISCTSILF